MDSGCHGGRETMQAAARAAGKSAVLDQLMTDYPRGPHDQPQSMCPAFGSLRVGLRMRRTATILCGSACCVYGLTFTSHFYGAKRSVGYVPFNSESLVRGELFEDIRNAVTQTAKPEDYDCVVVINLCVPTASGVPLDMLPKQIERRARHRHRRAGVRRADPCRGQGRAGRRDAALCPARGRAWPGAAAPPIHAGTAVRHADRRVVPGRSGGRRRDCWRRWAWPSRRRCPAANGATCTARWIASSRRPCIRSTPPSVREFVAAGRPIVGSGPAGFDGTADWLERDRRVPSNTPAAAIDAAKREGAAGDPGGAGRQPDRRAHHHLRLRRLGTAGRAAADRGRGRGAVCRHRLPAHRMERAGPRVAAGEGDACPVPRLAGTGRGGDEGSAPRPRGRHHAAGAAGQGNGHPRAVFHQHGLRAAAVRTGRGRGAGRHRRRPDARARAVRPDGVVLRQGRHVGEAAGYGWKGVPKTPPGYAERTRKAKLAREAAEAAVGT